MQFPIKGSTRKLLLIILGVLCCSMPAVADDEIAFVSKQFPGLNANLFFVTEHSTPNFAGFKLTVVSTLELLPPPEWVVATKGKQMLLLQAEDRQSWNKIVAGANLKLETKKDFARFPVNFLKITSPSQRAIWRFSERDLSGLSAAGKQTIARGWRSQNTTKGVILNFFSTDLVGDLSQWRLVLSRQGAIRSMKRVPIK